MVRNISGKVAPRKRRRQLPADLSLSQTQADFLFALVTLNNNSGEGTTSEALAAKMRSLGHSTYTPDCTMIPRLVHELRNERNIPVVNLPALLPDGSIARGYGLENFKQVTLPRTAHFLMAFREFHNDEEGGRPAEKHVEDFKEYLLSKGFDPVSIEDDLKFTLDHGYLMGFPNKVNPTHLRSRNRIAYELRYLVSLAKTHALKPGGVRAEEASEDNEVKVLSELESRVLFTVWEMESNTNKPPAFEMIQTAVGLSRLKLEKLLHRLNSHAWPIVTPFMSEKKRTFRIAHEHIVGWPRTAALLVLIGDGEYREDNGSQFQFRRRQFIEFARIKLQADFDIDSDLEFAARNHYLRLKGDHMECFWPDDRLYAELPFLRLIGEKYKPLKSLGSLAERHANILMALWSHENWATRKRTSPDSERPFISFAGIADLLKKEYNLSLSAEQVKLLVDEIFEYQYIHQDWDAIIQLSPEQTGIRFFRLSPITHPESASLILYLAEHGEADAAEVFSNFSGDLNFFKKSKSRYMTKNNELTERVEAEREYLSKVAQHYKPEAQLAKEQVS